MTVPLLTRVFVYGTLRPGERNEAVARRGGAFTAVPATLPGYRLLHLRPEAYPGVVPGEGNEAVHGDVLTYREADWGTVLPFLDELEGIHETPPLYVRQQVEAVLGDGARTSAWVYLYADAARLSRPGAVPVPGGDWRARPDRTRPSLEGHGPEGYRPDGPGPDDR